MRKSSFDLCPFYAFCSLLFLVPQVPSVEYQIKASFLYNFAQFVQWPVQAFSDRGTPFTICVAGDLSFQGSIERITEGERLNGRQVAVRRLDSPNVTGCHILYVASTYVGQAADMIRAAGNMPVLTVGESSDFINAGGMIRFTEVAHRVRFEINPDAVQRASLRASSRLLRVADIVRPRQRGTSP